MKFRASDFVHATPEQTFAWWTDLREDDAGSVMPPLRRRRIIRRTATEVETEDDWSIFGFPLRTRAVLRPLPPDRWMVISRFRGGTYWDLVQLEAAPGGTRVTMEMDAGGLRWPWSWGIRILRSALEGLLQRDLEAVNRGLEESLNPSPLPD